MLTEAQYALLRELGSGGYGRHYLDHEKTQIEALYMELMGRPVKVCNCKNRHHDAVLEMLHIVRKTSKTMANYVLKAGVVICTNGAVYTNANLTDEVAERFLAEKPNARGLFAHIAPKKKATPKRRVATTKTTKKATK